jgi:alkylation response protein AidB-like acyl-CoA dehydrogenase
VAAAKQFVVETALMVTEKAMQVAGGKGITGQLPLERYFRDARAGSMQPPSGDTALEMVGREAIGGL